MIQYFNILINIIYIYYYNSKKHTYFINIFITILDNALLTQSRFILMESILMQFSLLGLLCIVKFRKVMDQPTSLAWWIWLILGVANLTCALWYAHNLISLPFRIYIYFQIYR